jgi:hypothetical protein
MTGRSSIDLFLTKNRDMLSRASIMADQKASIILGSEFIILTLIITGIWNPLDNEKITAPPLWSVALVISILVSVTFALFVLLPSMGLRKKKPTAPNLLFFSSIAEMDRDDYVEQMKVILKDDEKIYEAILKDLHSESIVLKHKKFRYLKVSYLTLILGMPVAIFMFLLERHTEIDSVKILGPLFNL